MNQPEPGPIRPEDLEVTLAVRRDLGEGHDEAVIGEFLNRVGSAIDARVDAHLADRPPTASQPSIALGVASIALGIPITAIALGITHGAIGGIVVLIIAWAAIAVVNLAHARRR